MVVAKSKLTGIEIRAGDDFIGTSSNVVAPITGTGGSIVTEQLLRVNTSFNVIADIRGTDGAVITDGGKGPIAVVSARWIIEDTSVNGTWFTIVTIIVGNTFWTKSWTFRVNGTSLMKGSVFRVDTRWSTIARLLGNDVEAPLGRIVAITDRPVGVVGNTWFRATIDFSFVTLFSPVLTIEEGTVVSSTLLIGVDVEGLDMSTNSTISRAVTWAGFITTNTVNWGTWWARCGVINGWSTRFSRAVHWGGDVSGTSLIFVGWTEWASNRLKGSPLGHDTIDWTTSRNTDLSFVGWVGTFGSTIRSGLVDDSSSGLDSFSASDRARGPGFPFSIGTWNWGTSRSIWDGTSTSVDITLVLLASISEGRTVLWSENTCSRSRVSITVTDRDVTWVGSWAGNSNR